MSEENENRQYADPGPLAPEGARGPEIGPRIDAEVFTRFKLKPGDEIEVGPGKTAPIKSFNYMKIGEIDHYMALIEVDGKESNVNCVTLKKLWGKRE